MWPDDYIECTLCGEPAWVDTQLCVKCEMWIECVEKEKEAQKLDSSTEENVD